MRVGRQRLRTQELPAQTRMSRLALGHIRARLQGTSFTAPCKSELAAAAVLDDPSRI
jgi:hypothetical protein